MMLWVHLMSFKKKQFETDIQNEANSFIRKGLNNPHLTFVSITKVKLNDDFSMATLYWDTFDPAKRGDIKSEITKCAGKIRSHLAKTLNVRHTPSIELEYDSQFEDESAIDKILQEEKSKGKGF